jgi:hypothetical protein
MVITRANPQTRRSFTPNDRELIPVCRPDAKVEKPLT